MNPLVKKNVHRYVKDLIDDHLPDAEKEDQSRGRQELGDDQRRRGLLRQAEDERCDPVR